LYIDISFPSEERQPKCRRDVEMGDYRNLSDNRLIELLRESDHPAFEEIYRRYYPLMLNFAFRKLFDTDLSKDFVQELFTNIWYRRELISESGNFASFLYTSLRSRIFDYFDHQNVESKYFEALQHAFRQTNNSQTDFLARERSMNDYIERQIMSLPKKMSAVFQMSRKEHLSHKQIAVKLNTTEENVSKHITRALKSLKAKLTTWIF